MNDDETTNESTKKARRESVLSFRATPDEVELLLLLAGKFGSRSKAIRAAIAAAKVVLEKDKEAGDDA